MSATEESRAVQVARAFFSATTKLSENIEDILPQEDGADRRLSVFCLFSELFPEFANDKDRPESAGKNGLMRLQFNKIGYEMYDKEQSRRVPAVRAKPGNPGYGFRRARWRETMTPGGDLDVCESVLAQLGVARERLECIKRRVHDFKVEWDLVRRPSRPAGPGRPRGHKRGIGADGALASPTAQHGTAGAPMVALQAGCFEEPVVMAAPAATKKAKKVAIPAISAGVRSEPTAGGGAVAMPSFAVDESWGMQGEEGSDNSSLLLLSDGPCQVPEAGLAPEEENLSLRSLNKSLILDREALMRNVVHQERDLADLIGQCDALLHTLEASNNASPALVRSFRTMSARISISENSFAADEGLLELTDEEHAALDGALDVYDDHLSHRLPQDPGSPAAEGASLWDLQMEDAVPSCDALRELVRLAAPSLASGPDRSRGAYGCGGDVSPVQCNMSRCSISSRDSGSASRDSGAATPVVKPTDSSRWSNDKGFSEFPFVFLQEDTDMKQHSTLYWKGVEGGAEDAGGRDRGCAGGDDSSYDQLFANNAASAVLSAL
eukprot:CAMPEP_0173378558 /NCGR_PEP_ID=MMETSP1356-20130122/1697_1 /TAXON_ID=77927 ORGANISM="Hemiselmis virescens, Strain PCC157" /NCGR_SAMPLE_ID=MMETSP1356 /ASSEMBLY_ACC=CAM_ASM_000847 /LENGTH=550 /DNA_ID=CAMNT_0014331659 /DNA_START=242 /DNA_END=1894 /DNA_ORIENTATION=-